MNDRFDHLFICPSDFAASLAFYRDVLGWSVLAAWDKPDEGRGAVLSGGGVKVILADAAATARSPRRRGANGAQASVHLDIHDVDARFRALPGGTHVVVEPEDTQWGTRWFVVRDPDGNLIAFEELHGQRG